MVLNQSGNESQQKLQNKHIVIIGCGAVTGAMAEILARAGVEKFTLIDDRKFVNQIFFVIYFVV